MCPAGLPGNPLSALTSAKLQGSPTALKRFPMQSRRLRVLLSISGRQQGGWVREHGLRLPSGGQLRNVQPRSQGHAADPNTGVKGRHIGRASLALGCPGRGPQCSGEVHTRPRGPQPVDAPPSAQLAPPICPGAQSTRAGCRSSRLSRQAGVRGRQLSPAPRWPTWDTTFPLTAPAVSPVPAPPSAHVVHVGFRDPTRLEEASSRKCGLGAASARRCCCLCPSSQCPPGGLHLVLNTPKALRPSRGPTTPCAPS